MRLLALQIRGKPLDRAPQPMLVAHGDFGELREQFRMGPAGSGAPPASPGHSLD